MKKSIHFIPSSLVCSVAIDLTVEDGVIREVCFEGGCSGNLQGIDVGKGNESRGGNRKIGRYTMWK